MSMGGMPLLSGPPHPHEYPDNESSCRKCDKEFNLFFTRSRKCNHCGYLYCHSCTDFQALMPRSGSETGYDPVPVCAFCVDNLTITAGGKNYLRALPLGRLKQYASAYNIRVVGVLEKDDLVNALIVVRERNGCLPRAHEDYYRKNSVPKHRSSRSRGIFTRAMDAMGSDRSSQSNPPPRAQQQQRQQRQQQPSTHQPRQRTTSGPSTFPRPDLDPGRQPQGTYAYGHHPPPPPPRGPTSRPPPAPRPQTTSGRSHLNVPGSSNNTGGGTQPRGRTRAASASSPSSPRTHSPAPPVPTLDELLEMPEEAIARLSIGTLKAVLFQNHVNARLVVEKAELVAKVRTLVEDERRERERHAAIEVAERAAEEEARREREDEARRAEEQRRRREEGQADAAAEDVRRDRESAMDVDVLEEQPEAHVHAEGASDEAAPPPPPKSAPPTPPKPSASPPARGLSPKAQAKAAQLERTGLCVICQDEEANIAIVDCGHLCLCRACSELIMKGSRECPLCRTRIVTEQRLLRIFRS